MPFSVYVIFDECQFRCMSFSMNAIFDMCHFRRMPFSMSVIFIHVMCTYFSHIRQGKAELKRFCRQSGYEYDENLVDRILLAEQRLKTSRASEDVSISSFPKSRRTLLKLFLLWFSGVMVYYSILLGDLPGGVLLNNLYIGQGCFYLANLLRSTSFISLGPTFYPRGYKRLPFYITEYFLG